MTDESAQLILSISELKDGYRIVEQFCLHPSGPVYRISLPDTEKTNLLRVLSFAPEDAASAKQVLADFTENFRRVNHPKLQPALKSGFSATAFNPYILSPDVDGETLASILKTNERVNAGAAVDIALAIAGSLKYAHELGIVHGNLCPANIVLRRYKERFQLIRILGFEIEPLVALTKNIDPSAFRDSHYMSPEQCNVMPLDQRSDIYSLGCILYEMVTGKPPHTASQNNLILLSHVRQTPALFHEVYPEGRFPVGLQEIVLRCLAKNPEARYQNLAELEVDLLSVRAAVKVIPAWLTRHVATVGVLTILLSAFVMSGIAVAANGFIESIDEKVSFSIRHAVTGKTIYRSRFARTYRDIIAEALNHHVSLEAADLRGANLSGMDMRGAKLSRAVMPSLMIGTNFDSADLTGANFDGCKAMSATFRNAKLDGATLRQSDFSNADFTNASVSLMMVVDCYRTNLTKTAGTNMTAAQEFSFRFKN